MERAATNGMRTLSSISIFPTVTFHVSTNIATTEPRKAAPKGTKKLAPISPKNIPANVPSQCFFGLYQMRHFPKYRPMIFVTESPKERIIIDATAICSGKRKSTIRDPTRKKTTPRAGNRCKCFFLSKKESAR